MSNEFLIEKGENALHVLCLISLGQKEMQND